MTHTAQKESNKIQDTIWRVRLLTGNADHNCMDISQSAQCHSSVIFNWSMLICNFKWYSSWHFSHCNILDPSSGSGSRHSSKQFLLLFCLSPVLFLKQEKAPRFPFQSTVTLSSCWLVMGSSRLYHCYGMQPTICTAFLQCYIGYSYSNNLYLWSVWCIQIRWWHRQFPHIGGFCNHWFRLTSTFQRKKKSNLQIVHV